MGRRRALAYCCLFRLTQSNCTLCHVPREFRGRSQQPPLQRQSPPASIVFFIRCSIRLIPAAVRPASRASPSR
eukprot:5884830-Pyramimonas_sp.AAC.1